MSQGQEELLQLNVTDATNAFCKLCQYMKSTAKSLISVEQAQHVYAECQMLSSALRPLLIPGQTTRHAAKHQLTILIMCLEHSALNMLSGAWRLWQTLVRIRRQHNSTKASSLQEPKSQPGSLSSPPPIPDSPYTKSLLRVLSPLKQLTERQRQVITLQQHALDKASEGKQGQEGGLNAEQVKPDAGLSISAPQVSER